MLSISLLGNFCIRRDGVLVTDLDTPRLQSLLAYLLLHREAPQSRAYIAFLFWPDTTEAQARTNLRYVLHHLRHAFPDAAFYLDAHGQTIQWRSDAPYILDVADFDSALNNADLAQHRGNTTAVRSALEQAVAVYKGDLLPSCYDDWILPERERLRQAYLDALEMLARIQEDQRDYQVAIQNAQRLLRHDPLHEATYRHLIRLHALIEDRAGALRTYHTCATVLRRELEVEPSATTREAYEKILGAAAGLSPAMPVTSTVPILVGREKEWLQMQQTWHAVADGEGSHVVMLCGEAGIGKTRLAEELIQWATRQGIASASARCYAAEGQLAYAPVTTWLRSQPLAPVEDIWLTEIARLLPEVLIHRPDLPRPTALTEAWQRQRLFEALSRAILGMNQPLLLTIDDLQWCDRDTLEWLHFMMRFNRSARLLIIGTYRPEEIGDSHPLLSSLQALRLEGQVTELNLGPLDEVATAALATQLAGVELGAATAQFIIRETEGNPLFVVETVRAGLPMNDTRLDAGAVREGFQDSLPGDIGLPPKVQAVLEARLAQLSPPTRELAEVAATIGREFSFELLAKVSSLDEELLVRELDELWRRHIVQEHGAGAYDFSHDKLREGAYSRMSAARQKLLHRHAAQSLETLHNVDLDPVSHQVAFHYERAGLLEQAARYYLLAARVARRIFANEEAINLLQRGLMLIKDDGCGVSGDEYRHEVAASLYEELGDTLELRAQFEGALQAYQNAQAQLLRADGVRQARLHRKVGAVFSEQRLFTEALDACHRAEIALGKQPDGDADPWWDEWLEVQVEQVWAHYWLAQWLEMDNLVRNAQPIVQKRGSGSSRMRFLVASCLMHLRRERYVVSDEMLSDSREALTLSREWGSLKARTECQFELGFLHLWRREFDEAEENLQAALELAENSGNLHFRILSLTYMTILYRFRDQEDNVREYAQHACEVAEAAHMPDYVAAAKSNLAWLAWHQGNLPEVEKKCRESLAIWRQSPLVYPFQWLALWPLIAVALIRGRDEEAYAHAQALIEPRQQHLPEKLNATLTAGLQAGVGAARPYLDLAVELAREMAYI